MRVGEIPIATMAYIKLDKHYKRLAVERQVIDRIIENIRQKEQRRVQEEGKGYYVDVMV